MSLGSAEAISFCATLVDRFFHASVDTLFGVQSAFFFKGGVVLLLHLAHVQGCRNRDLPVERVVSSDRKSVV